MSKSILCRQGTSHSAVIERATNNLLSAFRQFPGMVGFFVPCEQYLCFLTYFELARQMMQADSI